MKRVRYCRCGCGGVMERPKTFWLDGHNNTLPQRLWARVEVGEPDQCWPWTGATIKNGYGVIGKGASAGGNRSNILTHVAAYLDKEAFDLEASRRAAAETRAAFRAALDAKHAREAADKGIAHWLAAVNNDLWSKPDGNWPCTPLEYVMSGYIADVAAAVERIGDASPADFEITERER